MAQINCILYKISTDTIIDYNFIVNSEALPLTGYDPDLKVYAKYTPYAEPSYDSRGWILVITGTRIETPHPIWTDLLTYEITYSTQRRTNAALYLVVDDMLALADNQLLPANICLGKQQRTFRIHRKEYKGLTLSPQEEALVDEMDLIANAMDDNADNADAMKDYIDANPTLVPDFDAGWTTEIV